MQGPCKVCLDGSCYGCTIARHKSQVEYFARDLFALAEQCSSEEIHGLFDAGVLTHHDACHLLQLRALIIDEALKAKAICERTFAIDVFNHQEQT